MDTSSSGNYEIVRVGETDVVRITRAKFDYPALENLQQDLDRLITDGSRRMIVDVSLVTFLDSFGVGVIAASARRMEQAEGRLALCGVGDRVRLSLTITRLDQRLTLFADEAEALESMGG